MGTTTSSHFNPKHPKTLYLVTSVNNVTTRFISNKRLLQNDWEHKIFHSCPFLAQNNKVSEKKI